MYHLRHLKRREAASEKARTDPTDGALVWAVHENKQKRSLPKSRLPIRVKELVLGRTEPMQSECCRLELKQNRWNRVIDKSLNTVLIYRQIVMPTPAIRGLNANLCSETSEFMASLEVTPQVTPQVTRQGTRKVTRQGTQSTSSGMINARSLIPTADHLLL